MRFLLDTHVWLWSAGASPKLPAPIRRALDDANSERWVSPISAWEILLLAEKKRIELSLDAGEWVSRSFREGGLREAPLTLEVALESRRLTLAHEDPADRFLAATARVYGLTLLTGDARLWAVPGVHVRRCAPRG